MLRYMRYIMKKIIPILIMFLGFAGCKQKNQNAKIIFTYKQIVNFSEYAPYYDYYKDPDNPALYPIYTKADNGPDDQGVFVMFKIISVDNTAKEAVDFDFNTANLAAMPDNEKGNQVKTSNENETAIKDLLGSGYIDTTKYTKGIKGPVNRCFVKRVKVNHDNTDPVSSDNYQVPKWGVILVHALDPLPPTNAQVPVIMTKVDYNTEVIKLINTSEFDNYCKK